MNLFHHQEVKEVCFSNNDKYILSFNGNILYSPTSEVQSRLSRILLSGALKVARNWGASEEKTTKDGLISNFPPTATIWPGLVKLVSEFTNFPACNLSKTLWEIELQFKPKIFWTLLGSKVPKLFAMSAPKRLFS